MEELKEFAKRLKEIRNEMKLSQKELAEKVGITAASLSAYEQNQKNPSFTTVMKIAEICGVSLDWLCGKAEKRTYNTINTYGDIFQMFVDIDDFMIDKAGSCVIGMGIDIKNSIDRWASFEVYLDWTFADFFEEWENIRELYGKGTIDRELYDAWLEKKKREYNFKVVKPEEYIEYSNKRYDNPKKRDLNGNNTKEG